VCIRVVLAEVRTVFTGRPAVADDRPDWGRMDALFGTRRRVCDWSSEGSQWRIARPPVFARGGAAAWG
jgi:hypothetical protein